MKLKGYAKLEKLEKGKLIELIEYHNIVVYTGINLIYDLLSGDLTDYYDDVTGSANWYIKYIAIGSSPSDNDNTMVGASIEDWRLSHEGDGVHTCRAQIESYVQEDHKLTVQAVIPDSVIPGDTYEVWEMGAFVDDTPPLADPEIDETQKPHTMFNRIVFPNAYGVPSGIDLRCTLRWNFSEQAEAEADESIFDFAFYETFDLGIPGSTPSGWSLVDGCDDGDSTFETNATHYISSPYCAEVNAINSDDGIYEKDFSDWIASGSRAEGTWYIYVPTYATNVGIFAGYGSIDFRIGIFPSTGIVLYFMFVGDGSLSLDNIYYYDENGNPQVLLNNGVIPRDQWIKIRADMDLTTDPHTADVTISDMWNVEVCSGSDLTVLTDTSIPLYKFAFGFTDITGAGNSAYIDHIKIEEV